MAEITAQLVKQLREKTSAGMMECKKALEEAKGNLEEAEVVLRKRGMASAAKKSSRSTKQGSIGTGTDAQRVQHQHDGLAHSIAWIKSRTARRSPPNR